MAGICYFLLLFSFRETDSFFYCTFRPLFNTLVNSFRIIGKCCKFFSFIDVTISEAPNNTDPSETSVNKKLLELAAAIQRDAEKMDLLSLLQNLATLKKEAEEMLDASEKGKEDGKQQRGKRKQQKPHSKEQRRMERVRRSAGSLTPLEVHRRFASQLSAEGETAVLEEALSALEEGSAFRRVLFKRRFTCSSLVADVEELFKPWRDTRLTRITVRSCAHCSCTS